MYDLTALSNTFCVLTLKVAGCLPCSLIQERRPCASKFSLLWAWQIEFLRVLWLEEDNEDEADFDRAL